MSSARELALLSLLKFEREQSYSNFVLNSALKQNELSSKDSAFFSVLFYGTIEQKLTLDYIISKNIKTKISKLSPHVKNILRLSVYQLLFMDKIPPSAVVNEAIKLAKKLKQAYSSGFINAVLRKISTHTFEDYLPLKEEKVLYFSIKYSCPEELVEFFIKNYKEQCEDILRSFLENKKTYLRVNTLKTTADNLIDILSKENIKCEKHEFIENAIFTSKSAGLTQTKAFTDGLFHIQDISSQLCCHFIYPKEGEKIADVCASPGGKSFTIAQLMNNEGSVDSFDIIDGRVNMIKEGADRLSINCICAGKRDAAKDQKNEKLYDAVLCDVPCSGLGVIGKKPEIKYKSLDLIKMLPDLQYEILCNSSKLLKPGGRLIYSTCTLNPYENEEVLKKFLKNHKEFVSYLPNIVYNVKDSKNVDKNGYITLLPFKYDCDGFFIGGIKKMG